MKASELKRVQSQVKDENYWKQIIEDYEASNLTRSDYCRMHQINYDNFGYWCRKLKKQTIKSLVPIKIKSECNQHIEKNKVLSTLLFTNGNSLHIYDKEVVLMILSKVM
jgi:hypothetical protein